MSTKISRREFLKLSGLSAAVGAVLTGCGPTSRFIVRRPYTDMPEYQQTGKSTYYATTCRECPAGCGLIVRTFEGRAIKAEGNPNHPVNRGKICSKGLTAVQGLYNPDRLKGPQQVQRGSATMQPATWDAALGVVAQALANPAGTAFLLGNSSNHLTELITEFTAASGAPAPVSYGAYSMFDTRRTLVEATRLTFGQAAFPYFDIENADLIFSFGADFLGGWLSPISYSRAYGRFRQGRTQVRGYLVSFEPYQSITGGTADEWHPIAPGTEGLVALAIGRLAVEIRGGSLPAALQAVDIATVAQTAGIDEMTLHKLGALFAQSTRPLALPGGAALANNQGLSNAQAVLALNGLMGSIGTAGGMFLQAAEAAPGSMNDVLDLVNRMNAGEVQALFIHGANPVFELPAALGFAAAMQKVPLVVSFASFADETALLSDYILPDHSPLEAFGYQNVLPGSDRSAVSAMQPVVTPLYDTKSTVDVLLASAAAAGAALPYTDEVDFIQKKLVPLMTQAGLFSAPEILSFWTLWLQNGGWWKTAPDLQTPAAAELLSQTLQMPQRPLEADELYFITYPGLFGDGSLANRPWLQETPDPLTTVMWNSYVLINPETALELGVRSDDIVTITSDGGTLEAVVYEYPAIRPDTVAMPFGQGHTAPSLWAEGRGSNPAAVLEVSTNESGELAYAATRVKVQSTGRRRPLSRLESKAGVYGEH